LLVCLVVINVEFSKKNYNLIPAIMIRRKLKLLDCITGSQIRSEGLVVVYLW
jgi:hypothetical protein